MMTFHTHFPSRRTFHGLLVFLVAVFLAGGMQPLSQAAVLSKLTIQPEKGDRAGFFLLGWEATPDTLYRVQSSTNSGNNVNWLFGDAIIADSANAQVEIKGRSIPENSVEFFRLMAQPEVFSLEPTWVDSGDSNSVLYILGQCLPTNGSVVINGHTFTVSVVNTGGVWGIVSLNGLPPGEPWIGTLDVIDNGTSNVVAQYKLQSGFIYATQPPPAMLQSPPEEPPAKPTGYLERSGNIAAILNGNTVIGGLGASARRHGPTAADPYPDPKNCAIGGGDPKDDDCDGRVDEPTGELRCQVTDLGVPGRGLDFIWARTYRSRTGPTTAMGHGWDFSYNVTLTQQSDGTVQVCMGNGRCDTFYPNGTNGWSRDEYFVEVRDLNGDGMPDVLFADGGKWLFNPFDPIDPAAGKLNSSVDRNGNTMRFEYDGAGRLGRVVDTLDRTNSVAYNSTGLLESVTDFSGRVVRYEYDGNGDLAAVVSPVVTNTPTGNDFPGGKTNRYTYTSGNLDDRLNHNLASCVDAKGQTWLQVAYRPTLDPAAIDFDAVDSVTRGSYVEHLRLFPQTPTPSNGFARVKAILRDAVGNVSESFHDSRQRCVRLLEYTGRAPNLTAPTTEVSNRPTGKLRVDDPDFYETQWTWNPDSLCTLRTTALGDGTGRINRVRMVYQSTADATASPRKKGDLRVLREISCCGDVDSDGDGVGDFSERSWHFDYDPNFGSPATMTAFNVTKRNAITATQQNEAAAMKALVETAIARGQFPNWSGARILNYGAVRSLVQDFEKNTEGVSRIRPKGWDGTIKGNMRTRLNELEARLQNFGLLGRFAAGPRQTTSQDGTFSHGTVRREYNPSKEYTVGDTTIFNGAIYQGRFGRPAINEGLFISDAFVTSATDPRGNVTTASHDTNGNLTRCTGSFIVGNDPPVIDLAYNSYGQLTAITNAADGNGIRRVDTCSYYTNGPQLGMVEVMVASAMAGGLALTTAFEHDPRGNVIRCVDPRGFDTLYTYNAMNQCVRVETPTNITSRCTTDYIYDANNNLVRCDTELRDERDALRNGHVVAIGHDFLDRIASVAEQVTTNHFVTNKFFYDGNNNVTAIHSPLAATGVDPTNIVTFQYDERNLPFREICASGGASSPTNEYSYNANGNPVLKLGPVNGGVERPRTAYAYDGFNRCTSITDPMSNVVTRAYDRNDNLILARVFAQTNDVPGDAGNLRYHEWTWEYDALDRRIESRTGSFDPVTQAPIGDGASVTTFTYAPNSQCKTVTDDNGHTTSYAYDTAGRLAQITDPKLNLLQFTYDAGDNLLSMTSVERSDLAGPLQQFTRTYAYDSWGRRVQSVDNVGNTNSCAYDSFSRVVRQTDPKGNACLSFYDDLGRRTLAIGDMDRDGLPDVAVDVARSWTYDDNSRCVSTTDDNTNTMTYAYDSLNRRVLTTSPDGTAHTFVWDTRSELVGEQDANGTVISNSFDLLGRWVARSVPAGAGVSVTTTFERFAYDGLSRLVAATNDNSFSTFRYDSLGNCIRSTQDGLTTTCTYDGVGNRTSISYPSGLAVGYTYDALDQVSTVRRCEGCGNPWLGDVVATYAYDGPDRIARITRTNGVNTRITWNGTVNPANAVGDFGWRQVSGINHQVAGGGAVIDRRSYAYDPNQNKILRAQLTPFTAIGDTFTNVFEYDALNRLTNGQLSSASGVLRDQTYQLDGNGNRVVVLSNDLAQPYLMESTIPPADFQMDQYTLTPFGAQIYDENGNLVARGATADLHREYLFDYADRLVHVQDVDSSSGSFVTNDLVSFSYDALGRRITKTVYPPIPLAPETTAYLHLQRLGGNILIHGDSDILEERVTGVVAKSFVLDATRSSDDEVVKSWTWRQTSGPLLMHTSGEDYYFHKDDLGNVLALTDGVTNVVERYAYDDYGEPEFLTSDGLPVGTNASPAGNPYLFHGMTWNAETGLYWGHSQGGTTGPMDPKTGRFVDGRYVLRAGVPLRFDTGHGFAGDNPWSGGSSSRAMAQERVKLRQGIKIEIGGKLSLKLGAANGGVERPGFGNAHAAKVSRNILKTYFETGNIPTQEQFLSGDSSVSPGGNRIWPTRGY